MNKKEQPGLKEALRIHIRSYKELNKYCSGLLPAYISYALVSAIIPYATIYFSAQIINELAGARCLDKLWFWVGITIGTETVLAVIKAVLFRWKNSKRFWNYKNKIFVDKILSMDYADVDKQENRDLHTQVQQNEQWGGWGYHKAVWILENAINALCGIIGAIALTISLFTLPVPKSAGGFVVLNHPVFLVGLIVVMALVTLVGPLCNNIANAALAGLAEEARLGNRIFGAF